LKKILLKLSKEHNRKVDRMTTLSLTEPFDLSKYKLFLKIYLFKIQEFTLVV